MLTHDTVLQAFKGRLHILCDECLIVCFISSEVPLVAGGITLVLVSDCVSCGDKQRKKKKKEYNAKSLSAWAVCSSPEQC